MIKELPRFYDTHVHMRAHNKCMNANAVGWPIPDIANETSLL